MIAHKKLIIWDWNGTLLDDVSICIDAMNSILAKRSMDLINRFKYKEIFDFPVIDYYKKLGFNLSGESFEELSVEFINNYSERLRYALLHNDVLEILQALKQKGKSQVILSAMQRNSLEESVQMLQIRDYFDTLVGLDDIYASGKEELARHYFHKHHLVPEDVLFIGDTIHDYEVAESVGADCLLISCGHHSFERLVHTGVKVLRKHKDLISLL